MLLLISLSIITVTGCTDKEKGTLEEDLIPQELPEITVITSGGYTVGPINEAPLEAARKADEQWRVLAGREGFRALITVDTVEKDSSGKIIPGLEIISEGRRIQLSNAVLIRSTDSFKNDCYYLTSDIPSAQYGLGVGVLNPDSNMLYSDNFFAAQWNGEAKFFEGETGPSNGEKIVISISGFFPEA